MTAYDSVVLADAPIAYYATAETSGTSIVDVVGGKNMSVVGSAGFELKHPQLDGGITFQGSDYATNYAARNVEETWHQFNGVNYSVEFWFRTSPDYSGVRLLVGSIDVDYPNAYLIQSFNNWSIHLDDQGYLHWKSGTNTQGYTYFLGNQHLMNGDWHHVVASLVVGSWQLYVDGNMVITNNEATAVQPYAHQLVIGRALMEGNPVPPHIGQLTISNIAIYDYAMSDAQTQSHYLAGGPNAYHAAVLADTPWGYWPSRPRIRMYSPYIDRSGNSNHFSAASSGGGLTDASDNGFPFRGPTPTQKSLLWAANTPLDRMTDNTMGALTEWSLETWFMLASSYGGIQVFGAIAASASGTTLASHTATIGLDATMKPRLFLNNGAAVVTTAAAAVPLNTWIHMVGTFGPSGCKLYVNGVEVASSAAVPVATTPHQYRMRGGYARASGSSLAYSAAHAAYTTQLSAARVLAHYEAALDDMGPDLRTGFEVVEGFVVPPAPDVRVASTQVRALAKPPTPDVVVVGEVVQALVKEKTIAVADATMPAMESWHEAAAGSVPAGAYAFMKPMTSDVVVSTGYKGALLADGLQRFYRYGDASGTVGLDESGNSFVRNGTYTVHSTGPALFRLPGFTPGDDGYSVYFPEGTTNSFRATNIYASFPTALLDFDGYPVYTQEYAVEARVRVWPFSGITRIILWSQQELRVENGILTFVYRVAGVPGNPEVVVNTGFRIDDTLPHTVGWTTHRGFEAELYPGEAAYDQYADHDTGFKIFVDGVMIYRIDLPGDWYWNDDTFYAPYGISTQGPIQFDSSAIMAGNIEPDRMMLHHLAAIGETMQYVTLDADMPPMTSQASMATGGVTNAMVANAIMPIMASSSEILGQGTVSAPATMPAMTALTSMFFEPPNWKFYVEARALTWPQGRMTIDMTGSDNDQVDARSYTRWYAFAPSDIGAEIMMSAHDLDTIVQLYKYNGPNPLPFDFDDLTLVHSFPSSVPYLAEGTEHLYVRVASAVEVPNLLLEWARFAPPANDLRPNATNLGTMLHGAGPASSMLSATLESGSPSGAIGVTWWKWTAPQYVETTFHSSSDVAIGLTVYIDGVQNGATDTGKVVDTSFVANPGQVVEISVASYVGGADYTLSWTSNVEAVPPAPLVGDVIDGDAVAQYLRVEVYLPDGQTMISELPRRMAPSASDSLNEVGMGTVSIPLKDPVFDGYPQILNYRNIVKFWIGPYCVFGFRIKKKTTVAVSSEEYSGRVITLSGPSVLHLMADGTVQHDGDTRPDSLDTRQYSWASKRASWYNPAQWQEPIASCELEYPPGGEYVPEREPRKERPKYGNPKGWKDPEAKWMYITSNDSVAGRAALREGGVDQTYVLPPTGWGDRYFRKSVYIETKTLVRMFLSTDEYCALYLDGEKLMEVRNVEVGYEGYERINTVLTPGWHTIAMHQKAFARTNKADGVDAVLFSCMRVNRKGKAVESLFRSNSSWEAFYGEQPPGWNRAEVLRNFVFEGRARGVNSLNSFSFGFTDDTDSEGRLWDERFFNQEVAIGTNGVELISQLAEGNGIDVWMDPGPMVLHASKRRGANKAASVALQPGRNLMDWSTDAEEDAINSYLVHYDGGFIRYDFEDSIARFGRTEGYITLGNVKRASDARRIIRNAGRGMAYALEKVGSDKLKRRPEKQPNGSVIAVLGAQPFIDFNVGDVISAPNEAGYMRPHRVMALTLMEDENGFLTYDPELEIV